MYLDTTTKNKSNNLLTLKRKEFKFIETYMSYIYLYYHHDYTLWMYYINYFSFIAIMEHVIHFNIDSNFYDKNKLFILINY